MVTLGAMKTILSVLLVALSAGCAEFPLSPAKPPVPVVPYPPDTLAERRVPRPDYEDQELRMLELEERIAVAQEQVVSMRTPAAPEARKDIPVPLLRRWCSWGWTQTVNGISVRTPGSLVDTQRSAAPWVECKAGTPPVVQRSVVGFLRAAE